MTRSIREERLAQAIAAAAQRLQVAEQRASGRTGPPAPGDVYALAGLGQDDLGWLVVQSLPDQPGQLFVVPLDDYPQCGTPDVPLSDNQLARCGEGAWVPASLLPKERVDVLSDESLLLVRAGVAALALGGLISDPERQSTDDDLNYQRWMRRIERARRNLEKRVDSAGRVLTLLLFQADPPAYAETPLALAASTGGLVQEMEEADRSADQRIRHHLVPLAGGNLRLAGSEHGLMLLWEGTENDRIVVRVRDEDGKMREVPWQPVEGKPVFVTALLRWIDGRVVLQVGNETMTILR